MARRVLADYPSELFRLESARSLCLMGLYRSEIFLWPGHPMFPAMEGGGASE